MSQYINLLNPALRQRRDALSLRAVLGAAGAALLIVALIGVWSRYTAVDLETAGHHNIALLKEEQAKLVALAKQSAERKPDAKLAADLLRAEAGVKARGDLVQVIEGRAFGRTEGFSEPMRAFARQSLNGLWLTGFNIQASSEMEINGRAINAELLPTYIRRLNSEPAFQGKQFAMLDVKTVGAQVKPVTAAGSASVANAQPLPAYVEFSLSSKARRIDLAERQ
ncbi:MAG: PilN domain-containing protein [Burkholderiales bacterium]|nr:PilN domain-containing protein [Burkholderiales bacterium]